MGRFVFGAWEPDKAPYLSDGLQMARNVYPAVNGYRPIKGFAATPGGSLPSMRYGAASFVTAAGGNILIAGTSSGLYRAQLSGFSTLKEGYTLQDGRWNFVQFGGLAIATDGVDKMQKIDLSTTAVNDLGNGAPAEKGTPPKAKLLAIVKDFLVAGVVDGDVQTLQWSGINDAEWWTIGQNQCDYQVMPSGGEINGIFGGEMGLILQRNRITRMTYVGDNVVFQIDEISSNVGCVTPNSIAQWGNLGFFLSDHGFMMWDGGSLKPIGQERVDRYFSALYGKADFAKMSTAIDPNNTLVIWNMGDRMILYNWILDRFAMSDLAASYIFPGLTRDVTLDELNLTYQNLDAMPVTLDDPSFIGGDPQFYLFDDDNNLGTLSGPNMEAECVSGRIELVQGRTARIRIARTLSDADGGFSIEIGTARRLGEDLTVNSYGSMRNSGDVPVREEGRFASLGVKHNSGSVWSYTQGLDLTVEPGPWQ